MMTQKTRLAISTLVMAGVAAGGLAWAWFGVHEAEKEEEARKEAEARVLPDDLGRLASIALTRPGQPRIVLERLGEGDDWTITAPVETPAEPDAVDILVERLLELKAKTRVLEADEVDDPSLFGLADPPLKVRVESAAGAVHELALGDVNPFDRSLYLRRDDGPVVLVDGSVKHPLDKSLFDLRERRVLRVPYAEAASVSVTLPEQRYTLTREEGDRWRVSGLAEDRADTGEVRRVLSYLEGLLAQDFPDKVLPTARLESPTAEVRIGRLSGDEVRLAIVEEAQEDGSTRLYGTSDQLPGVIKLGDGVLGKLRREPFQLRHKKVVELPAKDVARISVRTGSEEIVLERADDGWKMTAPRQGPAVRSKVDALLYALTDLQATNIVDGADPRADHGLASPGHTVAFFDAGGEPLATLLLGDTEPGGARFATTADRARVYTVPTARLHALPATPEDLLEAAEDPAGPPGGD